MEPKEVIKEERMFLHDISNQLLVAQGMGGFVNKVIKKSFEAGSKEAERSEKAMQAIAKMAELVKSRRALLHTVSDD